MVKRLFLLFTALFCFFVFCRCGNKHTNPAYGEIVKFEKNIPLAYPDFEIIFTGERRQTSTFPNGNSFTFTYFDFKLKKGNEEKTVSWTSGTGIIEPASFEFGGSKFQLELRSYDKEKKKLNNDEMVITKL
jgi:hypothetical protein